jgi:hypothetical protein
VPALLPAASADAQGVVRTDGGRVAAPADVVTGAFPPLVVRVFDAEEPLANYGLDDPQATIEVTVDSEAAPVLLSVGDENFDASAFYVQRAGDERVWLVLDDSIRPLLALISPDRDP